MFLYEMHCHTAEGSRCASLSGAELIKTYASKGYHGIVVTDHFYGGNTAIDQNLPWNDWVCGFLCGYRNAKSTGEELRVQVFLGWEFKCNGTELLTYGLGEEWLLAHPELTNIDLEQYCALVRKDGGILVHAHPFRMRNHHKMLCLLPTLTQGVETVNKCNDPKENFLADQYAGNFGLMKLGGTDLHHAGHFDHLGGIAMPYEATDIQDIFAAAKEEQVRVL